MTGGAPEVSREESRALWIEVARWPLAGGMLGGVLLLTAMAFGLANLEGGASQHESDSRALMRGALTAVSLMTLGHYAWSAVSCTFPAERPVPWGKDEADGSSLFQRLSTFVGVFALSFLPVIVWVTLEGRIGAPSWLYWIVIAVASFVGATIFPLGLAGSVAIGSAMGALPWRVRRMWKANPPAARIAATSALLFVGMFLVSAVLVDAFVSKPKEADFLASPSHPQSDGVSSWLLWTLVVLRAAGFYAALVSCRVAGLLVREVEEIREVLK